MQTVVGRGRLLVVLVLLAARAGTSSAAHSCVSDCPRRMTACHASRCGGLARKACRDTCRALTGCRAGGARTRVLASVVTECRVAGGEWTLKQRFEIQRGDCPPLTVREFASIDAVADIGLCQLYGQYRLGSYSVTVAPLQRVGLSPDGHTILFEVTTRNVGLPGPSFDVAEEGIFAIESDGSRIRTLGPPSREKPFKGPVPANREPGFNIIQNATFEFSPDGRFVVFEDRGPGSDGMDAGQLVVMDIATGERRQVTALDAAMQSDPAGHDVFGAFLDNDTIIGNVLGVRPDGFAFGVEAFLVQRDGTGFRPYDPPVPVQGAHVVPDFEVAGAGRAPTFQLPQMTTAPYLDPIVEMFFRNGDRLLQLTNFGRSDTQHGLPVPNGTRIVFRASADPLGSNPTNTCQLFSIDRFGGPLRQLTRLDAGIPSQGGCGVSNPPPACWLGIDQDTLLDPKTRSLVFESTCDPFGLGLVGEQYYAMRPNGSGFRQLTHHRGMQVAPDGSLTVELPGPTAYSGRSY